MKRILIILMLFSTFGAGVHGQSFQVQVGPAGVSRQASSMYQEAHNALRMRRLTLARQLFEKLIEEFPGDVYASLARRSLAEIHRDLNNYEDAIRIYKDIIANDSTSDNQQFARQGLLDLYFQLQRFREGIEQINSWRETMKNNVWLERQLARFYLQTGRKDEAWLLLETVLERTASQDAFEDLLELAMKTDEVDKLLNTLNERRARFRNRDYTSFVADCYLAQGRKKKAIEVIKSMPDLDREWLLLKKLADLQIEADAIEEAYQTLQKVHALVRNDWNTLKKMGHCLFVLDRRKQALEVWRKILAGPGLPRQEHYINYTTVLLEHQLYEEALDAYREGRLRLGNRTMFAEEMASVLEALGRSDEALGEYIQVLVNGHFKLEVFDRLYESMQKGFELESRLVEQLNKGFNLAVRQALLELHFRLERKDSPATIVKIVNSSGGALDDFFYERLNQEASIFAGNFHVEVCVKTIQSRSESTLAIKAARLLLKLAEIEAVHNEVAFENALLIVNDRQVPDAELEAELIISLAEFVFTQQREVKKAHDLLDKVLQTNLLKAAPRQAVKAAIFKAHLFICQEKFKQAESLLRQNHKNVEAARENIFAADPIGDADYQARILLKLAFLEVNQSKLQEALNLIKTVVEDYSESIWANDALNLGFFITRTSVGDFSLLNKTLKARRLAATGDLQAAGKLYDELIAGNASMTEIIIELEAEKILQLASSLPQDEVLKQINTFVEKHKENFMAAELLELKLDILRRKQAPAAEIKNLLQKFMERFPTDLRSVRYKKLLAQEQYMIRSVSGDSYSWTEKEKPAEAWENEGLIIEDVIDLDELEDY